MAQNKTAGSMSNLSIVSAQQTAVKYDQESINAAIK